MKREDFLKMREEEIADIDNVKKGLSDIRNAGERKTQTDKMRLQVEAEKKMQSAKQVGSGIMLAARTAQGEK